MYFVWDKQFPQAFPFVSWACNYYSLQYNLACICLMASKNHHIICSWTTTMLSEILIFPHFVTTLKDYYQNPTGKCLSSSSSEWKLIFSSSKLCSLCLSLIFNCTDNRTTAKYEVISHGIAFVFSKMCWSSSFVACEHLQECCFSAYLFSKDLDTWRLLSTSP